MLTFRLTFWHHLNCVVHFGGHQLARCYDDILALFARKVAVDISGVFQQVCGITLQKVHLLQSFLELLRFFDHLKKTDQNVTPPPMKLGLKKENNLQIF